MWIKTFRLSGPGYISANGGAGNSNGGGGSGGRVNIYANTGDFRTGHIINTGTPDRVVDIKPKMLVYKQGFFKVF